MDYTKQNRKEFRVKVLKDQLKTCLADIVDEKGDDRGHREQGNNSSKEF